MAFITDISTKRGTNQYEHRVSVGGDCDGIHSYLYRVEMDGFFNTPRLVYQGTAPFTYSYIDKKSKDNGAYMLTKTKYDPSVVSLIIPYTFWYYRIDGNGIQCNAGHLPGDLYTVYTYTDCSSSSSSCHHTTGAWYGIDGVIKGESNYHNHSGSASISFTIPNDGIDHDIRISHASTEPDWDSMTKIKQNKGFNPFKDDLGPMWKVENGILKPNINTTELDNLRAQVAQLTNDKQNLQSQINNLNSQISSLRNERNQLQSNLNNANRTIDSLNQRIAELEATLAEKENKINELNAIIADKNSQINDLNTQINDLNTTIAERDATIEQLNNTIAERDATIEELNTIIDDLTFGGDQSSDKLANLQLQLDNKIAELESITQRYNDLLQTNEQLLATIDDLEKQIDQLEDEKSTITAELSSKISSLEREINTYKARVDSLNNTINDLNRQIALLESQINNSGSSNSELLEKLNIAERELDELNNEVLVRLQEIESKLDVTNQGMSNNSIDIEEMKSSLIRDITSALGTPRFGFMPLPLAKQAIAVSGELLSDANTGHLYLKNGNRINSKTLELEDHITDINEFTKSAWVAISINSENYNLFTTNSNINSNSDNTLSSSNGVLAMNRVQIKYDPLTVYTISVRAKIGGVARAYFVDEHGNEFDCVLRNSSGTDYIYRLESTSVGNSILYPVVELKGVGNTVESILIYKALSNTLDNISDTNGNIFGGNDIDETLIDSITIVNNDKSFTVNNAHPIRVTIPKEALKSGLYTLVLRAKNNPSITFTAKTIFNGTLYETKQLDFSSISMVAGGKTGFAEMNVPNITSEPNYIEISTNTNTDVIVEYFILSLIDFDRSNFYTKAEINAKDIPTGKTTNSGNNYTLTTGLVTNYYDGLLCKIKINANSTGEVTFRCNNQAYKNVVDANGNRVKNFKNGIWYHVCYNGETGNFTLLGKGGGGTAATGDVVSGKTFTNDNGEFTGSLGKCTNIGSSDGSDSENLVSGSAFNNKVGRLDLKNLSKSYIDGTMTFHIKNLLPANIKKGVKIGGDKGILGTLEAFSKGDTINIYEGTNITKELFFMGPLMTYSKGSNSNTYGDTIIPYGDKKFVCMTEYCDWGSKNNTYQYDLQVGSLDDGEISCKRENAVGVGKYSTTSMYKVGVDIVVVSHSYNKNGDNTKDNKVSLFNTETETIVGNSSYTSKRYMKFNANNMSCDKMYIYGTMLNSSETTNTAYVIGRNRCDRIGSFSIGLDDTIVTDVIVNGDRYILIPSLGRLKVFDGTSYAELSTISLANDANSIVTFNSNKAIIGFYNRYQYVEFYKNGTALAVRVLKEHVTNKKSTAFHYKDRYVIVSTDGESFIHRMSDGGLDSTAKISAYKTNILDGIKYSYKNQTSTIQILGAPLYLQKL